MIWRKHPTEDNQWQADSDGEPWCYNILEVRPFGFRAWIRKPKSTKAIFFGDTFEEARKYCERFDQRHLERNTKTSTNIDTGPQKPGIPW